MLSSHLVKKQSTSWKVLCLSKKKKKILTLAHKQRRCYYNNQEISERRLGPLALLSGKCQEDPNFDGESRDRRSRLPKIIKESVLFRIEVHISCKTFLYFFNSLKQLSLSLSTTYMIHVGRVFLQRYSRLLSQCMLAITV